MKINRPIESVVNEDDPYPFGVCPHCGRADGLLNIGKGHWFYCSEHRVRWCFGSNLITIPADETEEVQRARFDALDFGTYQLVDPSMISVAQRRRKDQE